MPANFTAHFPDFAARLDGTGPLGVAVSGGGDSVALLYALAEWGQRPLEVFCVDHGLNPASPQWTQSVAEHAARVGAGFTALYWQGDKPVTGLSAAARTARHGLLAEAVRQKSVRVLCLAHTADDIAEAEAMRAQGSNVGAPQVWVPSPAWPQGRGVFLYRPLLAVRREALRGYLRALGVTWIDDPSNDSQKSLRARARKALHGQDVPIAPEAAPSLSMAQMAALLHAPESLGALGIIAFNTEVLQTLSHDLALKCLAMAAVCAGGGDKLPRRAQLEALHERLATGKALTLCGARLQQSGGRIVIAREPGDIERLTPARLTLEPDIEAVWDGRFTLRSVQGGRVWPSRRVRSRLDVTDQAVLAGLPAVVRGSLAVVEKDNSQAWRLANPLLRQKPYKDIATTCLVLPRFYAAVGAIVRESALSGPADTLCGDAPENGV